MKRALSLVAVLGLGLALSAMSWRTHVEAEMLAAVRPASDLLLFIRLNGSPLKLGVITSAGASTTNASTAVPFTINASDTIEVSCDAAAFCVEAATATNLAGASPGRPMAALTPRQWVLKYVEQVKAGPQVATFACFGVGAFNCAVFTMQ